MKRMKRMKRMKMSPDTDNPRNAETPAGSGGVKASHWTPFSVAVAVLLVSTLGWGFAMRTLKWYTRKEPVPWPAEVTVDEQTFQNTSMPDQFGPYKLVTGDGVIPGRKPDGKPDGELKYSEETLEALGIGSSLDGGRHDSRMSNWYVTRIYEDTREKERSAFRFWQIDIVYYSGGELSVPHVPDECVQAAGAVPVGRDVIDVRIPSLPEAWAEWRNDTKFVSLKYQKSTGSRTTNFVQYYLFSMCGLPRTSRERVRLGLMDLGRRYVYFSKVQFFPVLGAVGNPGRTDSKAAEFLSNCLPYVLKQLPSAETIRLMEQDD